MKCIDHINLNWLAKEIFILVSALVKKDKIINNWARI